MQVTAVKINETWAKVSVLNPRPSGLPWNTNWLIVPRCLLPEDVKVGDRLELSCAHSDAVPCSCQFEVGDRPCQAHPRCSKCEKEMQPTRNREPWICSECAVTREK